MMETMLYTIQDRARNSSAAFARPEHFTLDEAQPTSTQVLLNEPGWTPYCLDDENRRVLFVNTPPDVDLSQAAFVYTAQFEQARRALTMPYEVLVKLTEEVKAPDTMIFVYSMGRCGSTLMNQILNQIEGVYALSEPDVFTNIGLLRAPDGGRDDELSQLLRACTLFLSPQASQNRPSAVALKFRSHTIGLSDLIYQSFPEARNLFMYRNAVSWAKSVFQFLQRLGYANELSRAETLDLFRGLTGEETSYVERYMDDQTETFFFSDLLAPAWTSYLDRYMANYERGVPFHTIRYEDLNDNREATLKRVLDYCGLPTSAIEQAMQGFATDSQAGTEISRDAPADELTPERIAQFLKMLSRHPEFNQPDFMLPDSQNPN